MGKTCNTDITWVDDLTDFTVDALPALVTFTVVAADGVHAGAPIHTHVHVTFIDI